MRVRLCGWLAGIGALVSATALQAGTLTAEELLLLYNSASSESRQLAQYYAEKRGVPADRLLGLRFRAEGPFGEDVSAEEYERSIRTPIREYLDKSGLRGKIRCLVACYGLPLRVGKVPSTPQNDKLRAQWRVEFESALDEFEKVNAELSPTESRPSRRKDRNAAPEMQVAALRLDYFRLRQNQVKAAQRATGEDAQARMRRIVGIMQRVEGLAGVLSQVGLQPQVPGMTPEQVLAQLKQALQEKEKRIAELLGKGLVDPSRDEARRLMREVRGLSGLLDSLAMDIGAVETDRTDAALDSELALLWWEHPKYLWIPNVLCWRHRSELTARGQKLPGDSPPVLMVARIDGPTFAIARGLIDKALAAERTGPTGTVYIDARGLKGSASGYGEYDDHLRRLGALLKSRTRLTVQLDDQPSLFQRGQCPNTMLYCGWYSVRKYVDAFTFSPGAVGYHIASFEAASLKGPNERGWCRGMLQDGITATLGPVTEPYLHTFPRPDDFFGLLLTGRFTLAEVYAYTVPFHSWMMTLIGDPLYRPYGARPVLALEEAVPAELIPPEYAAASKAAP